MLFHADSSFTVGRGQYAGDLHPTWGGLFDDGRHLFPDAGAEHAAGPFGRFWAHVKNKAFELADTIFYQCYARDATDAATHGGIFCARVPDC